MNELGWETGSEPWRARTSSHTDIQSCPSEELELYLICCIRFNTLEEEELFQDQNSSTQSDRCFPSGSIWLTAVEGVQIHT